MAKEIIKVAYRPTYASKFVLPISPGTKAGGFIFVSGNGGYEDRKTGKPIEGIEAQTRQCIEHVKEVIEAAGSSLADVVKVTVFLTNAANFQKMNEVYVTYFPKDPPARSAIVTNPLDRRMLIEMECIAYQS